MKTDGPFLVPSNIIQTMMSPPALWCFQKLSLGSRISGHLNVKPSGPSKLNLFSSDETMKAQSLHSQFLLSRTLFLPATKCLCCIAGVVVTSRYFINYATWRPQWMVWELLVDDLRAAVDTKYIFNTCRYLSSCFCLSKNPVLIM